ncbi:MAG: class II fructose-bisphosphate aldolase [Acidobacteriota bacterium]|nr:class II fructose-bisphosphate aldolase [Acidobacteriota bacterium]
MPHASMDSLIESLAGIVTLADGRLAVKDANALAGRMDALVRRAVFGDAETKAAARWIIGEAAQDLGIRPSSIHGLYMAMGRGETGRWFTVPAMNLRVMAYDSARAIFRAAKAIGAGAFIIEIARSEIGYTDQRPAEYVAAVLAAAIREGHRGPVFIQGDHFQVSAKKYAAAPEPELQAVRDLIVEAVSSSFFNIDIDTSTLVDLAKPTLEEQQRLNYEHCADFAAFIRSHEPAGTTISIGGEIGEVGLKNSTPEDLDAFMAGFNARGAGRTGISKISIQTGTSHGGVVLPDGTLAKVSIDFETLRTVSERARKAYGMAGAVQHGASTLPDAAFHKFVEVAACEVHLATAFQTLILDHPAVPEGLKTEIVEWVKVHAADERKAKDSEAQFIYKARKKAVGPFKEKFWSLPEDVRAAIGADLEKTFAFLFDQLAIAGTKDVVAKFVATSEVRRPMPQEGVKAAKKEDVSGLAD